MEMRMKQCKILTTSGVLTSQGMRLIIECINDNVDVLMVLNRERNRVQKRLDLIQMLDAPPENDETVDVLLKKKKTLINVIAAIKKEFLFGDRLVRTALSMDYK